MCSVDKVNINIYLFRERNRHIVCGADTVRFCGVVAGHLSRVLWASCAITLRPRLPINEGPHIGRTFACILVNRRDLFL